MVRGCLAVCLVGWVGASDPRFIQFALGSCYAVHVNALSTELTRFNKIAIQGAPQMAVDKEAISLSRVYSYYYKCNLPLFYV